ncbi:galactitol-1-phosphate 5-dehydrogenase [soil metagenome]
MKALTLIAPSQFAYAEAPEPEVGANDVLIRVAACGICGSDVHGMNGSSGRRIPPIIMGHETAGVIEKVGAEVEGWAPGDRVTVDSTVFCGECPACLSGRVNLCPGRRVLGVSCGEYRRHGAFAELLSVSARILYRLPEGLGFEEACFVEPVAVALHAVGRIPVKEGDTAVVVGAGIIGLLVMQALRVAGASRVIAVDLDEGRLALARELGAEEALLSDADAVVRRVGELTGGKGADVVMEVVGIAPTVGLAVRCARLGGSVGLVGNLAPQVDLPLQAVVTREITLYGSCSSAGEYDDALRYIAEGAIKVMPLVSQVAALGEGAAWFQKLAKGDEGLVKVILRPPGAPPAPSGNPPPV